MNQQSFSIFFFFLNVFLTTLPWYVVDWVLNLSVFSNDRSAAFSNFLLVLCAVLCSFWVVINMMLYWMWVIYLQCGKSSALFNLDGNIKLDPLVGFVFCLGLFCFVLNFKTPSNRGNTGLTEAVIYYQSPVLMGKVCTWLPFRVPSF